MLVTKESPGLLSDVKEQAWLAANETEHLSLHLAGDEPDEKNRLAGANILECPE
jgi:hypothetical protein